jgi:microcystin-dependent protein
MTQPYKSFSLKSFFESRSIWYLLMIFVLLYLLYPILVSKSKSRGQEHFAEPSTKLLGFNNVLTTDKNGVMSFAAFPKGTIMMWNGNETTIPQGWVLCMGQTIEGFKVPDLRGRIPIGYNTDSSLLPKRELGATGGEEEVKLEVKHIPSHTHTFGYGSPTRRWAFGSGSPGADAEGGRNVGQDAGEVGDNTPHENMPPFSVVTFIIKL